MQQTSIRLDKWLWFARFCKSRTLAGIWCEVGRVRVNRQIAHKAHQPVRVGDVLTFAQGPHVRVVAIRALGSRRGPASEAATLYDDLAPPTPRASNAANCATGPGEGAREAGAGRPTKLERRALGRLRGRE